MSSLPPFGEEGSPDAQRASDNSSEPVGLSGYDPWAPGTRPGSEWSYRAWDGSQESFIDELEDLFDEIADDLLYHGSPDSALRRMLSRGFDRSDGKRVEGIRELMERLREARQRQLERSNSNEGFEDLVRELDSIVEEERGGLENLEAEAEASGDDRRRQVTSEVVNERGIQLDLLPADPSGRIAELQNYEFVSEQARQHFEELQDKLREELANAWFDKMSESLANPDPEQIQRTREMFDALNQMIEQKLGGDELDPTFDQFMEKFGDFFPDNPSDLDELLENLAQQMAAAQAVLDAMTPEQRAQLQQLAESLFEDMDFSWQVSRLSSNLQRAIPGAGWGRGRGRGGRASDPFGFARAVSTGRAISEIDQLLDFLGSATSPDALAEVDLDQIDHHLGPDAVESLKSLASLAKQMRDAGLIDQREGRYELTARAIRRIGQRALSQLFSQVSKEKLGGHRASFEGIGHEREGQTKPYEPGDPFNIDIERTVRNAVYRSGKGTPVRLHPDDFEIARTEALQRSSTVLMVDLSLSMPMRDNFLAAKKVAMAMHSLITTQFRRDFLGLVGFSEVARTITAEELPTVSWDFVYGTNMQHGLMLARRMLAHRSGSKQIIMITDGEPTAHIVKDGSEQGYEVYFNYPPVAETLRATLSEVVECTRAGIVINTFALDPDRSLQGFVQQMARLNGGRVFFTSPDTLGDYVLVDFLKNRAGPGSSSRRSA